MQGKLSSDFSIASFYYFLEASKDKVDICALAFKAQYRFFLFSAICYLLFKGIGDRVLPVKKPWSREISEVLLIVACSSWRILGILFAQSWLSLFPAMLLVLLLLFILARQ